MGKGKYPRICMYMFIRAYNWIPLSQLSPMHTYTTIHNMNIVMTGDFWFGSYINTTYSWDLRFIAERCFEK
jgi:hypothetical protein